MSLDLSYVTNDMDPARNSDYIFVRRAAPSRPDTAHGRAAHHTKHGFNSAGALLATQSQIVCPPGARHILCPPTTEPRDPALLHHMRWRPRYKVLGRVERHRVHIVFMSSSLRTRRPRACLFLTVCFSLCVSHCAHRTPGASLASGLCALCVSPAAAVPQN